MVLAKELADAITRTTGGDTPEDIRKALTNRHKAGIQDAMDACQGAMVGMDDHHTAHNKAYEAHKEMLVKCHKSLSDMLVPPDEPGEGGAEQEPEQEPDEDDKAIDWAAILTRAHELAK